MGAFSGFPQCNLLTDRELDSGADIASVQAAFSHGFVFPPPTAAAFALAREDGSCAGLAANGNESAFAEGTVGDVVFEDVRPYLGRSSVGQRIELDKLTPLEAERGVKLNDGHLSARSGALVASLAGDPGIEREDANLTRQLMGHIHQDHILGATGADREPRRIVLDGERQNFLRVPGGISCGKFLDVGE